MLYSRTLWFIHPIDNRKWKWKCELLSGVWLFATPWTVAHQAPLSMECSRQEYWSGLPCPLLRGSPQPRNQTQVSCIAGRFFTLWATREPLSEMVSKSKILAVISVLSPPGLQELASLSQVWPVCIRRPLVLELALSVSMNHKLLVLTDIRGYLAQSLPFLHYTLTVINGRATGMFCLCFSKRSAYH